MAETINLSKVKREKLLSKLELLKQQIDDEDIIATLNEVETELTKKKYGLVWEEHSEEVDEQMKSNIPIFIEDKNKEIISDETLPFNFLLEGDNLHSLKLLEKTHKGKIDIIYIDPPYNTLQNDFMYDDKFLSKEDTFIHSMWLSFMDKRLRIAKNLLKENGFIFISIDDHEAAQLKLLCDELFGESNYQNTYYIQVRYADKILKSDMRYHKQIEQVLVYGKTSQSVPWLKPEEYNYDKFNFRIIELNRGKEMQIGNKRVEIFQKGDYQIEKLPIGSKTGLKEIWASGTILNGNSSGRFFRDYLQGRKEIDGLGVLYKVYDIGDDQYNYRYFTGPQKANATKGKYYQGVPLDKLKENSQKTTPLPNYYDMAADFGNIRHEGGVDFGSGKKPVKLIKLFIDYFEHKNITVLDFFAGSGTTAQAVLEANLNDGGTRKFILCTNNQNQICEKKTYKRLINLNQGLNINGRKTEVSYEFNCKYYKTSFIPKTNDGTVNSRLLDSITELIKLEHHCEIDNHSIKIAFNDEEMDRIIEEGLSECRKLFVSNEVFLTSEQEKILENYGVEIIDIPEYYFAEELREVDEI